MVCPTCGYMMEAFDKACPRCALLAQAKPPAPVTATPTLPPVPFPRPDAQPLGPPPERPAYAWVWPWVLLALVPALSYGWHVATGGLTHTSARALRDLEGQTVSWEAEIVSWHSAGFDEWGIETANCSVKITEGPLKGHVLTTQSPLTAIGPMGVGTRGKATGTLYCHGDPMGEGTVDYGLQNLLFTPR